MNDYTELPDGYAELLRQIKARIQTARTRVALAVNSELIMLYWQIGRDILERQKEQGWGSKVIEKLSCDLRKAFPEMKGFSIRNLKYILPTVRFSGRKTNWGIAVYAKSLLATSFKTHISRARN